jgi:glycyl-tRNA synthetase
MDEIGTPFNITVDYDTKNDDSVTLRKRDTGIQKRIPIKEIIHIVDDLINMRIDFDDLSYPVTS